MTEKIKSDLFGKAKVGMVAGLVGGFALFSSFFAIDSQLDIPNGTFYKTIGLPLGLEGMDAIVLGFLAHMGASAIIGASYCVAQSKWRTFQVVTVPKGILTGSLTGLIVFGLVFLPIHTYVMTPVMIAEFSEMGESRLNPEQLSALYELLVNSDRVLWFAAFLHVLFGALMGLMTGMVLHEDYKKVKRVAGFL